MIFFRCSLSLCVVSRVAFVYSFVPHLSFIGAPGGLGFVIVAFLGFMKS